MKPSGVFMAGLALSMVALLPVAAPADDDLDVTMEVLDDIADMDGRLITTDGPDADEGESAAGDDDFGDGDIAMVTNDDFTHDSDFENDAEYDLAENESDFDEGEQVDTDVPEQEPDSADS